VILFLFTSVGVAGTTPTVDYVLFHIACIMFFSSRTKLFTLFNCVFFRDLCFVHSVPLLPVDIFDVLYRTLWGTGSSDLKVPPIFSVLVGWRDFRLYFPVSGGALGVPLVESTEGISLGIFGRTLGFSFVFGGYTGFYCFPFVFQHLGLLPL
jgi:hypothetical protein